MKKPTRKELFEARCKKLRDKANELGRDWLYSWEAAEVMEVNVCDMTSYNRSFTKRKADIPQIKFSDRGKKNVRRPPRVEADLPEKTDRSFYYPSGLQVSSFRRLADGRIAYMLK